MRVRLRFAASSHRKRELTTRSQCAAEFTQHRTSHDRSLPAAYAFTLQGFVSPIGRSRQVVAMAICWSLCRRFMRRATASSVAAWTAIPTPNPIAGLLVTAPVDTPATAPAAAPIDDAAAQRRQLLPPRRPRGIKLRPDALQRTPARRGGFRRRPLPGLAVTADGRYVEAAVGGMILGGVGIDGEDDFLAVERTGADDPADRHAAFLIRFNRHGMHRGPLRHRAYGKRPGCAGDPVLGIRVHHALAVLNAGFRRSNGAKTDTGRHRGIAGHARCSRWRRRLHRRLPRHLRYIGSYTRRGWRMRVLQSGA